MSQYVNVPKSDLDEGQIRELEQYEIAQGPLSVLQQSVRCLLYTSDAADDCSIV